MLKKGYGIRTFKVDGVDIELREPDRWVSRWRVHYTPFFLLALLQRVLYGYFKREGWWLENVELIWEKDTPEIREVTLTWQRRSTHCLVTPSAGLKYWFRVYDRASVANTLRLWWFYFVAERLPDKEVDGEGETKALNAP